MTFVLDGEQTIYDLTQDRLVYLPDQSLSLMERVFPEPETNWSLLVEKAELDAAKSQLRVLFTDHALPEVQSWSLLYQEHVLASGTSRPTAELFVESFVLAVNSCELTLLVNEAVSSIPILVLDLVDLPTGPGLDELGLRDLLALLGKRLGQERYQTLRLRDGRGVTDSVLDSIFGEGFAPPDVFKAWWSVATELESSDLSTQAFWLRIGGKLGLAAGWQCIKQAVTAGELGLGSEEAWFYGAELAILLEKLRIPATADAPAKRQVLDKFVAGLRADLTGLAMKDCHRPWVSRIREFYAHE